MVPPTDEVPSDVWAEAPLEKKERARTASKILRPVCSIDAAIIFHAVWRSRFAKDRAVVLESGGRTGGSGADEGVRPTESGPTESGPTESLGIGERGYHGEGLVLGGAE